MTKHIEENPLLAASLRICAVYITRKCGQDDMIKFWSQIVGANVNTLSKICEACKELYTEKGIRDSDDQLLVDIYQLLTPYTLDEVKSIMKTTLTETE